MHPLLKQHIISPKLFSSCLPDLLCISKIIKMPLISFRQVFILPLFLSFHFSLDSYIYKNVISNNQFRTFVSFIYLQLYFAVTCKQIVCVLFCRASLWHKYCMSLRRTIHNGIIPNGWSHVLFLLFRATRDCGRLWATDTHRLTSLVVTTSTVRTTFI